MKLSINGLSFSYEDKIIFNELSLNLSSEKISVLIGQNGVGKSTLLRIIAGLEEQDKGEITLSNNSYIHTYSSVSCDIMLSTV